MEVGWMVAPERHTYCSFLGTCTCSLTGESDFGYN